MITNDTVVYAMGWVIGVLGTGFVGLLIWFALRIVNQLDTLTSLVQNEFHALDLRVAKLESWRDGFLERDRPSTYHLGNLEK